MIKIKLVTIHSLPFVLGIICSYFFWHQPNLLLSIYIILTASFIWLGYDRKNEIFIALYGLVAGLIIEVLGTQISGYQSFTLPQIWGIPYWLIISWSFGFVLMKRISLIIGTGTAWVK